MSNAAEVKRAKPTLTKEEQIALCEKHLSQFPAVLDPNQVGLALGVTRRTVDDWLKDQDAEGNPKEPILTSFVLNEERKYKQRRVAKAVLIEFMMRKNYCGGMEDDNSGN